MKYQKPNIILYILLFNLFTIVATAQKSTNINSQFEFSEAKNTFKDIGDSTIEKYMEIIFTGSNIYKDTSKVYSFLGGDYLEFDFLIDSIHSYHNQIDEIDLRISIYKNKKKVQVLNYGDNLDHNFKFKNKSGLLMSTSGSRYVINETNYKQEWVVIPNQQKLGIFIRSYEISRDLNFSILRELLIVPNELKNISIID